MTSLPSICLRLAATAAKACRNSGILHAKKSSGTESKCKHNVGSQSVSINAGERMHVTHLSTIFGHQLPGPASGTSFGGNRKKIWCSYGETVPGFGAFVSREAESLGFCDLWDEKDVRKA